MGQYYKVVNLDRRAAINGHDFGDGIKLMEFGMSGEGTVTALAGQLVMDAQQTGPWAGHRVVIAGDYADEGKFLPKELADFKLYSVASGIGLDDIDDPTLKARLKALPAGFVDSYEFLTPADAQAQLKGLGISVSFGGWQDRVFDHLVNPAYVAEQPEDLFEAFDVAPCENLALALSWLLRCLRMSQHRSNVAWCEVTGVDVELDPQTQQAKTMTVRFHNQRSEDGPKQFNRTLAFPATQKDIVRFFGCASLTKQLENSKTARLR